MRAVTHWYDHVYMPVVHEIRRGNMLADFPVSPRRSLLFGDRARLSDVPRAGSPSVAPGSWPVRQQYGKGIKNTLRRLVSRLLGWIVRACCVAGAGWRLASERVEAAGEQKLFHEILVTLTGAPADGALWNKQRDCQARGALRGLHVLASGSENARQYGSRCWTIFMSEPRARRHGHRPYRPGDVVEKILRRRAVGRFGGHQPAP